MQKEFTTPFEEISPQELNKCLQEIDTAPNVHLLTWIIVGVVWSMTFQLSDIKVVFDRRIRY